MAKVPTNQHSSAKRRSSGQTLAEVLIAIAVIGLAGAASLGVFLGMNRNAADVRVMNLAKAAVLSRINEVSAVSYDPSKNPAVIPDILNLQTTTTNIDIGSNQSPLGAVPAEIVWSVTALSNPKNIPIRRVSCRINYQYRGRNQTYEMVTFRAPD